MADKCIIVEQNFLYNRSMSADGYLYISIDNLGTPVARGYDEKR
jgi:hypothetical protein